MNVNVYKCKLTTDHFSNILNFVRALVSFRNTGHFSWATASLDVLCGPD